ncbi:MAG: hypothetical protein KGI29_00175 [Pseudomonadota bacterium]|nr:hypothetical protein [Pseudomonadota bacterium]MDE3038540.1 hypothetical protein [Pseudomonadota bacterium]
MRHSWTQPSLSRDFALLATAVLFLLCLVSAWVTYATYAQYGARIASDLDKQSIRIEYALGDEMENASYLLTALGRDIVLDPDRNLTALAQILKSFDSRESTYTLFSWVTPKHYLVISSSKGVLDSPIDVSDRDYIKKMTEPWKMVIGQPVRGRASEHWVIPLAMGLTDNTGKFIGTLLISIDIRALVDHIGALVRHDGISFSIVNRSAALEPLLAGDSAFISHYFPANILPGVNLAQHPSGLIAQGSLFLGTGNYACWRALQKYPYVVLLGYDTRFSDKMVRGMLWSRLEELLLISGFLVLVLWVIRARLIKPVQDMTMAAAAVARGEACASPSGGGPVEIEALATQIYRISEYINESKRVHDELHNKIFTLGKARARAELDKRGKSEFVVWICQELQTPLTHLVGFAQVMKDQLYGPIENRKYRQYASDIHGTGAAMLETLHELMTLAKAETDTLRLVEKPVELAGVINKALRFTADKLEAGKLNVKVKFPDPAPRLVADEFRLQQIIVNLLLYALGQARPESTLLLEARVVNENRDKTFFAVIITPGDAPLSPEEMTAIAERAMFSPHPSPRHADETEADLSLELAKALTALHRGVIDIVRLADGQLAIAVLFAGNRIRFVDG